MADLIARTSGLLSKSMGSSAGGGAALASICELCVCVGRGGKAVAFRGGVIGL